MQKYKNIVSTKRLQQYLVPIAILIVACCVYWAKQELSPSGLNSTSELKSLQCNFVNSQCHFLLGQNEVIARFDNPPEVEEPITLSLSLPPDETIESAWIEGINMYMGKIPVLLESDETGIWQGWFMLGSCSQPVMQWRMTLTLKGRQTPAYLYFSTSRT